MKLLIDTSSKDLIVILMNKDNGIISHIYQENLIKKADALTGVIKKILDNKSINDITDVFVTIGPGSFVGSRVGLVYSRTMAQIQNINIHTTTSGQFYVGKNTGKFYIDAKSNFSYEFNILDGELEYVKLSPFVEDSKIDINEILKNIESRLSVFEIQKNILAIEPIYIKKPQIGGNK